MTLSFDRKEDLSLRMVYLEKKLEESEEERHKLEKTCNVLITAFREEEKMHYRALNKKYEQFLEDCTMRRRRNDIILRSLCIIEDRAKAVFAKTERLKLLKDRYTSHIKINDFKKDGPFMTPRTFPQQPTAVMSKSVHWKTPHIADFMRDQKAMEYSSARDSLLTNKNDVKQSQVERNSGISSERLAGENNREISFGNFSLSPQYWKGNYRDGRVAGGEMLSKTLDSNENFLDSNVKEKISSPKLLERLTFPNNYDGELKNEAGRNQKFVGSEYSEASSLEIVNRKQTDGLKEAFALREKSIVKHQQSIEKLKKALSKEDESALDDSEGVENAADELLGKEGVKKGSNINEKDPKVTRNQTDIRLFPGTTENNPKDENYLFTSPRINSLETSCEENDGMSDFRVENLAEEMENEPNEAHSLPKGLDGVDYQNEMYPESYYEQPVHQHNYSSIASDVILEEDESEQDLDQPYEQSKDFYYGRNFNEQIPGDGNFDEQSDSDRQAMGGVHQPKEVNDHNGDGKEKLGKSSEEDEYREDPFKGDNSTSLSEKANGRPASIPTERTTKTHSNLVHLLESDSESFQIEHGDKVSGNEDSDFDFSFH